MYLENYGKVEAYILSNSGRTDQAMDIFQEAFLVVWQHIKEGRYTDLRHDSLNAYLYRIAKNKWIDYLRSDLYKKTKNIFDEEPGNLHPIDLAETELSETIMEDEAKLERTMSAFQTLGDECKEVLRKFYFEKQSLREIAASVHIDEASAKNKKYRCMQKLREIVNNGKR